MEPAVPQRRSRARRAYTLVEVLVVVTILGLAAAIAAPSLSSAGVLRIQGAIRSIVTDIAIAQSDAIAYQKGRALVFYNTPDDPYYIVCEVNGPTIDVSVDKIKEQHIGGDRFGFATFDNINLPNSMIVIDELGGPVTAPASSTPAPAGSLEVIDATQRFRINIEAFTGKATVASLPR